MPRLLFAFALLLLSFAAPAGAQVAGERGPSELVIAEGGAARAVIVVAADAGPWEKRAAEDLRKYVGLMTGAEPQLVAKVPGSGAALVVGKAAVAADGATGAALKRVAKKQPVVRADAVSVRREGKRVFIAGSNDESHYFAASWLLQQWGCRWYMPTRFGEAVPEHTRLAVGRLSFAHAPPFELRSYWVAWNSDRSGVEEFQRRNFMSSADMPGWGHALDAHTAELAPPGGSHFQVPFSDPRTAEHVAAKVEADYAAGRDINFGIADGPYSNDNPGDRALFGPFDPYMLQPSVTDAMMTLYNNVARILRQRYPQSRSRIGGMAYVNATMPPARVKSVEPSIVMWIAPIDIDPNHAMDDPRSPPKREYAQMLKRWSALLGGRLAVYDYDQAMLVWRDLPNPSHHVFARDAKLYADAGILGFRTESRGALATTFLNLFFRGQLMWNPEADTDALLREFYPKFYGPTAGPMARYWSRIFDAWEKSAVTEHEYLVIPAIYTPELVAALGADMTAAEAAMEAAAGRMGRDEALFRERLAFTRKSFDLIEAYVKTERAAARHADYAAAVAAGEAALKAQLALRDANTLFTSGLIGGEDTHPSWLAGEVEQYRGLQALTGGEKSTLIARLPLEWSFRIDVPLADGWTYEGPQGAAAAPAKVESESSGWRGARTDIYPQAQGILAADGQSHLGHYRYRTEIDLSAAQAAGKVRLMFPGLFNEAWLYVNGRLVAHRPYTEPWWRTDYRFEWDVDLSGHLRPGRNEIQLRGFNPHHWGGIFRRPFLYRAN